MQSELSDAEMLACEPTKARFYWELGKFLDTTPYTAARDFAYHLLGNEIDSILVSVVIPFHNRVEMASEAIGSALQQTHRRLEIIVIDDGSTEDTGAIRQLCGDDRRCLYLTQAHQGRAAARNLGIERASGQFIALLDADAKWERDKVLVQLRAMVGSDCAFSHTSYMSQDAEGGKLLVPSGRFAGTVYPEIIADCPIAASTVVAKADVLKGHPFPLRLRLSEDVAAWIEIAREHPIRGFESALATVRDHSPHPGHRIKQRQARLENILGYIAGEARFDGHPIEKGRLALAISDSYEEWLRVDPASPGGPPDEVEVINNLAPHAPLGPTPLFEDRLAGFLTSQIRNTAQFVRRHKVIFRVLRPAARIAVRARRILR
jgi:hypothetical protein